MEEGTYNKAKYVFFSSIPHQWHCFRKKRGKKIVLNPFVSLVGLFVVCFYGSALLSSWPHPPFRRPFFSRKKKNFILAFVILSHKVVIKKFKLSESDFDDENFALTYLFIWKSVGSHPRHHACLNRSNLLSTSTALLSELIDLTSQQRFARSR